MNSLGNVHSYARRLTGQETGSKAVTCGLKIACQITYRNRSFRGGGHNYSINIIRFICSRWCLATRLIFARAFMRCSAC
jgi:hypothetical protein